jgi:CubicO group peptidase (beta-lactamase class C family)
VQARYRAAADYSAARGGRALVVVRGPAEVFAEGQNGHALDAPWPLQSASESFWGLAAAAADLDGLIDLDEPAVFTLPEFDQDPRKREIRLRELLHCTSGLAPGVSELSPASEVDLEKRALGLPMLTRPGERFQYGPGHFYVFGVVLERKLHSTGRDPVDYLEERLLAPIGMEVGDWGRDATGRPDLAMGARVSAREWARLGTLIRDRGMVDGRRVLPAEAVDWVLEGSDASPEYGLGWWLNRADAAGAEPPFYPDGLPDLALAAGFDNQRLYVIPSEDLVVVRFGVRDRSWSDEEFLALLVE